MQTSEPLLSAQQQAAKTLILDWLVMPGKQTFKLGGFAGVGKTFLIKYILQHVDVPYAVTSFTGKAVSVLRRKGVPVAQTMHSYLYTPRVEKDGSCTFEKKLQHEFNEELIVNDESSMVSRDLNNDLLTTGAKILYVGDPGQLEPVGDNPDLMHSPDIVLDEIHRQAGTSPILKLATSVRTGGKVEQGREECNGSFVEVISKNKALEDHAENVDQIICGYNATRIKINEKIREMYQYHKAGVLVVGEKLICLRNNARKGIFNGMTCTVEKIRKDWSDCWVLDIKDELGRTVSNLKANRKCMISGEWTQSDGRLPFEHNLFTYGYCITCHKSQGSEWDRVMVLDQAESRIWSASRWRYTAITRAAKELIYGV